MLFRSIPPNDQYRLAQMLVPMDDGNTMFYWIAFHETKGIEQDEWRKFCGAEVGKDIAERGKSFKGYACDFSDREAVHAFANQVKKDVGQIDILINNAGTIMRAPAVEHSDEYWDKVIEVNLNAQFVLSREFGKEMVARGEGKIVFTASVLTFQGGITVPGYAAAKGGIGQLTMALANEWASKGVNVNSME